MHHAEYRFSVLFHYLFAVYIPHIIMHALGKENSSALNTPNYIQCSLFYSHVVFFHGRQIMRAILINNRVP